LSEKTEENKKRNKLQRKLNLQAKFSPWTATSIITASSLCGKKWLAALGWKKGMPLKIEQNPNGSITVRKAQRIHKITRRQT